MPGTPIEPYPKAIFVGKGRALFYVPLGNADGASVTLTAVPDGFIPPHQVRLVNVAGTTATEIYTIED